MFKVRKVNSKLAVMVNQHVQRISKIVSPKVAVPSPMGVWVRIMPGAAATVFTIVRAVAHFMPVRAGVGMDAGSVTGKRDAVFIDQAALHGRCDGGGAERLVEELFIIKRVFIPRNSVTGHNFCISGCRFGSFFLFPGL